MANTAAAYPGLRDGRYTNPPYFFKEPVENNLPYIYEHAYLPELSHLSYPVYRTIRKAPIHVASVIPQYDCPCIRPEQKFHTPVSKAVEELFHPLFTYPYFLRRELQEERTNLFPTGREQNPLLSNGVEYVTADLSAFTRYPDHNELIDQYTSHVPPRTPGRKQRHVTSNERLRQPAAVVIVDKITYMSTSNDTSKFCDKRIKETNRKKRSLELDESGHTSDNCSQVRNKRQATEPMRVSLMDKFKGNNKARLQTRPSPLRRTTYDGNSLTGNPENSDCTSSYCKMATEMFSTENSLQLKTQEYLNKLKRDLEEIRSTIESKKQEVLNRAAQAKAKLQKQNSLSKDVRQRVPPVSKTNTKYKLLNKNVYGTEDLRSENSGLKSKGADLYGLNDDIMSIDSYRQARNLNSETKDFGVNNYGASTSDVIANPGSTDNSGRSIVTKLLLQKLVEEPTLMKFVKDYLLRFVNVTSVHDKEIRDTTSVYDELNYLPTHNAGKINVKKRSDGSRLEPSSVSCGAAHMCAHTAGGHDGNEKNSHRRLQRPKMEGVKNAGHGDNISSLKLPYDVQEEQNTCKCPDSSMNENKYGIETNTAVFPKTSTLVSNIKTALLGKQKTNQILGGLKLPGNEDGGKSYDAVRDSHGSLLDDLKAILNEQQCNCPRTEGG